MAIKYNRDANSIDVAITDGFSRTLIPFFSWCISQFSSAIVGCKLTLVLRQPSAAFKRRMMESWGRSDLFSASEIAAFDSPAVRRRCRNRLMGILKPLFWELRQSPECIRIRNWFGDELRRLAQESNQPFEMPVRVIGSIDITEIEDARTREIVNYSKQDITDTFPLAKVVKPTLVQRVKSEVGDYEETIRGLWWEASFNQGLLQRINISQKSKGWKIIGIDLEKDPDINQFIDLAFDLALNKVNEDQVISLARWIIGCTLLSDTVEQPYSSKAVLRFDIHKKEDALERDGAGIEEMAADPASALVISDLEDHDILEKTLRFLSPAERAAVQLLCKNSSSHALHEQLGQKGYETTQRNFERALKKIGKLKDSGKLDS